MRLALILLVFIASFCNINLSIADTKNNQIPDQLSEDDIVFGSSPDEDFTRTNNPEDIKPNNPNAIAKNDLDPMDIKNDLSSKKSPPKKPTNQLAQSFENDPVNFQDPKKSLEEDGGFFSNKSQAIKDKQIPKYPDRGNNKGLVRDLFSTLNNTEDSKSSKTNEKSNQNKIIEKDLTVDLAQNDKESDKGAISSFFKNLVSKTKQVFASTEEQKNIAPKKKINLADNFPDPTFYKMQRNDKYYKIPISVLNDKTNAENAHIPSVDLNQDYKILFLLFQKIKTDTNQNEIRAMLNAIKNKNLVNVRDQFGNTLLNYAVRFNNIQCFHSLMDYGADPNICNNSGICPLHLAIFNYQNYIFDLLLKASTKYDIKDNAGFDPLIYSIYAGNMYVFLKLLEISPYDKLKKSDYQYLLNIADESENFAIYEYIASKAK